MSGKKKNNFAFFNIFHQINSQAIYQGGCNSHYTGGKTEAQTNNTVFPVLRHLSADYSMHPHVLTSVPHSSSQTALPPLSPAKYDTANTNVDYDTDGRVGAPMCSHIILVTSVPSVGSKALHTHSLDKKQNPFPSTGVTEGGSGDTILQLEKKDPAIEHTER